MAFARFVRFFVASLLPSSLAGVVALAPSVARAEPPATSAPAARPALEQPAQGQASAVPRLTTVVTPQNTTAARALQKADSKGKGAGVSTPEVVAAPARPRRRVELAAARAAEKKTAAPAGHVDVGDKVVEGRGSGPLMQFVIQKEPLRFAPHELRGPYDPEIRLGPAASAPMAESLPARSPVATPAPASAVVAPPPAEQPAPESATSK